MRGEAAKTAASLMLKAPLAPPKSPSGSREGSRRGSQAVQIQMPRHDRPRNSCAELEKPQVMQESDLKHIFNKFDFDNSGAISESELHHAIREAGVNCSVNSAKKVLSVMDANGDGQVDWEEFREFFAKASSPEEIKHMLSRQNHRFFEYKQVVDEDPTFSKTFNVPPMVKAKKRLDAHESSVELVAWLAEDVILSCSLDGEALAWNIGTASPTKRPKPILRKKVCETQSLYSAAVSPDCTRLLVGTDRESANLALWSIGNVGSEDPIALEHCMRYESHEAPVYSCGFSAGGGAIVSGSKHGVILMHDATRDGWKYKVRAHANVVYSVAFRGAGSSVFCSASRDGTVKIFDTRKAGGDGEGCEKGELCIEDAAAMGPVYQSIWRGEGEILSCGDDYCVKRWDLRSTERGPVECYFGHTSVVRRIALSGDQKTMVSGTHSGGIRVWHTDQEKIYSEQVKQLKDVLKSRTAKRDNDQSLYEQGKLSVAELKASNEVVLQGELRVAGLHEAIRELKTSSCTQAFLGCDGSTLPVSSLAWQDSAEGSARLAVGSQDQGVRVFLLDPKMWECPLPA